MFLLTPATGSMIVDKAGRRGPVSGFLAVDVGQQKGEKRQRCRAGHEP